MYMKVIGPCIYICTLYIYIVQYIIYIYTVIHSFIYIHTYPYHNRIYWFERTSTGKHVNHQLKGDPVDVP